MKLVLIRHGEAQGNQEGRMLGCSDSPLTTIGIQQSQALSRYFAAHYLTPTQILSSSLQRATQTAQILASSTPSTQPPPIQVLGELGEIDLGILTGLTWAEATTTYPGLCQKMESQRDWLPVPQAERPLQIHIRATRVCNFLLSEFQDSDYLWIVSHGGFLQYLLSVILGCDKVWQIKIAPTAWFEIEISLPHLDCTVDVNRKFNPSLWQIHQFNITPHWPG